MKRPARSSVWSRRPTPRRRPRCTVRLTALWPTRSHRCRNSREPTHASIAGLRRLPAGGRPQLQARHTQFNLVRRGPVDRKPSPEIIDDRRARDTRRDEQWRSPPSNGYEQVHGEVVTKEDAGYIGMSACSRWRPRFTSAPSSPFRMTTNGSFVSEEKPIEPWGFHRGEGST